MRNIFMDCKVRYAVYKYLRFIFKIHIVLIFLSITLANQT